MAQAVRDKPDNYTREARCLSSVVVTDTHLEVREGPENEEGRTGHGEQTKKHTEAEPEEQEGRSAVEWKKERKRYTQTEGSNWWSAFAERAVHAGTSAHAGPVGRPQGARANSRYRVQSLFGWYQGYRVRRPACIDDRSRVLGLGLYIMPQSVLLLDNSVSNPSRTPVRPGRTLAVAFLYAPTAEAGTVYWSSMQWLRTSTSWDVS
ncbi:hypothetical protein BC629DRAFT_1486862 [Irpex lacteus]|nr:hypothetical protein BC629DRAFT_1486862 [Irpex lacteus]